MQTLLEALVLIIQLVLAGFVAWGGWLCFSTWRATKAAQRSPASEAAPAEAENFERVVSLVLLALLCTTIAGLG